MRKDSPFKEIDGVMYRKCIKCKEYKVFDDFNKDKSGAFGLYGKCKICLKKINKKFYKQNIEKLKEYGKEYREQNKDKIKKKDKKYYEQNKEKIKEYHKEYREKNRDKLKKYTKEHNKEYRDNIKNKYGVSESTLRYRKDEEHKLKCCLRISNYNNLKRALEYYKNGKSDKLPTKSPSRLLLKLYEIQNHNCPYCSNNMKDDIHIDHIISLSKSGSNEVHNLILCCSSCNLRKNAKELNVWLEECNINYEEFILNIERRNEMYFNE